MSRDCTRHIHIYVPRLRSPRHHFHPSNHSIFLLSRILTPALQRTYSRMHCTATHILPCSRSHLPAHVHRVTHPEMRTAYQEPVRAPNTFLRMQMGFCRAGISDPLCRGEMEEAIDRACADETPGLPPQDRLRKRASIYWTSNLKIC